MPISRRELLGSCTMWAALAAMPAALKATALAGTKPTVPLSEAVWTSLLGSTFQVKSGSTVQTLTLVSVEDYPAPNPASQLTSFSLRFYGGVKQLKQGTYTFQNATIGKVSLFMVPGNNPLFYEAIFNLL